jgi:protein subunit release factor B
MTVHMTLTAGAGGPESEQWCSMLLHMYLRWIARTGLVVGPGREITRTDAGTKAASLSVVGDLAKLLLLETGIHRLVRKSPLDAEQRRHTSFVSVIVTEADGMIAPARGYWGGHQIRSYVMHPYTMVKDLRTAVQRDDIDAVLDGDIDGFLTAAIELGLSHKRDYPNGPAAELD